MLPLPLDEHLGLEQRVERFPYQEAHEQDVLGFTVGEPLGGELLPCCSGTSCWNGKRWAWDDPRHSIIL